MFEPQIHRKTHNATNSELGFSKGIGVWAQIHRKTHNATNCELGFSKGIGVWARIHGKTHNATNWELGFSKGVGVWARIHGKAHNATNCELGLSKRNRIHCSFFGLPFIMATGGWRCVTCGTCLTHRRDRVCQRRRPGRRGRHNRLRPRLRLRCKQALSPETGTYGSFPLARRLQQPKDSGDQDLRAFRRAVENELTDLVALVGHATAHSILTHAHCLLRATPKSASSRPKPAPWCSA